jgi:hypothetical protein
MPDELCRIVDEVHSDIYWRDKTTGFIMCTYHRNRIDMIHDWEAVGCQDISNCTKPHDWRTGQHVPSGPELGHCKGNGTHRGTAMRHLEGSMCVDWYPVPQGKL